MVTSAPPKVCGIRILTRTWCKAHWLTCCFPDPEFKDIRREWKAKKKEEEARKAALAEEERQRQASAAAAQNGGGDPQAAAEAAQTPTSYPGTGTVQLPPIGYQPPRYAGQPPAGMPQQMAEYNYPNYSPTSPYGQNNQQMYNPRKWNACPCVNLHKRSRVANMT